jgi:hypothetical protein
MEAELNTLQYGKCIGDRVHRLANTLVRRMEGLLS